jgi:hypothetical protein
MDYWNALCRPPKEALRKIEAGRLKGKSDISPQWRIKAMTELFGPCGSGWKYEVKEFWPVDTAPEKMAFCQIDLYYKTAEGWSDPIPGVGGSMLTAQERNGLHNSDEAYKMAMTDALSVAMKALGVAADIYEGKWDGSKYKDSPPIGETLETVEQTAEKLKNAGTMADLQKAWVDAVKTWGQLDELTEIKDKRKAELGGAQ